MFNETAREAIRDACVDHFTAARRKNLAPEASHDIILVGSFLTPGEAVVQVTVELTTDPTRSHAAKVVGFCPGYGCTNPRTQSPTAQWRVGADVHDLIAARRDLLEPFAWAQSHAESCRAMPGRSTPLHSTSD